MESRFGDDATFLAAFERCEYPYEAWDHRAHIRMAFLYLCALPFDGALERIRSGIQAYNRAKDVPEGLTRGYHETLTVGWARLVVGAILDDAAAGRASAGGRDPATPTPESRAFCDRHPELLDTRRLDRHYTTERLWSPEAKRDFIEPDLEPLPGPD